MLGMWRSRGELAGGSAEAVSALPPPGPDNGRVERVGFLNREAAEVYLLLDFLSGRADRSVGGSREEEAVGALAALRVAVDHRGAALAAPEKSGTGAAVPAVTADARTAIEADLADPTGLVLRAMRIRYPLTEASENFAADATFLVRARDLLNRRAAPATGATVAFTRLVFNERLKAGQTRTPGLAPDGEGGNDGGGGGTGFAVQAFPHLRPAARALVMSIGRLVRSMILLLLVTLSLSAYTAWGKLVLDEIGTLRREFAAVGAAIERIEASAPRPAAPAVPGNSRGAAPAQPVVRFCERPLLLRPAGTAAGRNPPAEVRQFDNAAQYHLCDKLDDVNARMNIAYANLQSWARFSYPPAWPCSAHRGFSAVLAGATDAGPPAPGSCTPDVGEQWVASGLSLLGNYGLPVLYGLLGAMAFVLRRFNDRMADSLLTSRDQRGGHIRLALGALTGACIGLFLSGSDQGAAGSLSAVTLSTSALAFLAGYGVEGVFKALDGLIGSVFRAGDGQGASPARGG